MATMHAKVTTTLTPEQFTAGLTDFGPGRSKLFSNSSDKYLTVTTRAEMKPTSRKARPGSGNVCTTTGPIPTVSSSRPPTPTRGAGPRATPTPSHDSRTGRPTLTLSSCETARTSRDDCLRWVSGWSASAPSRGRSKRPSRPSKPATSPNSSSRRRDPEHSTSNASAWHRTTSNHAGASPT